MPKALDLADFLATPEPAGLGPGPRAGVQSQSTLEKQLNPLLAILGVPAESSQLIQALILLWHDHLEAAHVIAQNAQSADGAFVHGIMHRREPDFGNAAYWFRRAGLHPAFEEIASGSAPLLQGQPDPILKLVRNGQWDPFAFIDACEKSSSSEERQAVLREVQRIEFTALLRHLRHTA